MFIEVLTVIADVLLVVFCLIAISDFAAHKWGVKVKVVEMPHSTMPRKATKGAACFDLASSETKVIAPHSIEVVKTGLGFAMPESVGFRIFPRSGLATKGIIAITGTIDSDYRGEIGVILFNTTDEEFRIHEGMRIAQGNFFEVRGDTLKSVTALPETERGKGGFGSTGTGEIANG